MKHVAWLYGLSLAPLLGACTAHTEVVRVAEEVPPPTPAVYVAGGYVRGDDVPGIDQPALSTGLDKQDMLRLLRENLGDLRTSGVMQRWLHDRGEDRVCVFPFENGTLEPVDGQLDTILSETETWLVGGGFARIVARDQQHRMIREVERQQGPAFDPLRTARTGKQLGAQYYVTGKAAAVVEENVGQKRVQYTLFMQVIDVETSAVLWQHTSRLTKMRV